MGLGNGQASRDITDRSTSDRDERNMDVKRMPSRTRRPGGEGDAQVAYLLTHLPALLSFCDDVCREYLQQRLTKPIKQSTHTNESWKSRKHQNNTYKYED